MSIKHWQFVKAVNVPNMYPLPFVASYLKEKIYNIYMSEKIIFLEIPEENPLLLYKTSLICYFV